MAPVTRRSLRRCESGAQLIEFAMVFPMLMLMIGGIVDFGMMLRHLEVVTNAAREGARVAVLDGYGPEDVEARIAQYLSAAGLPGTYAVTVEDVPVTTEAGTFTARSVALNYTYQFAVLGPIGAFFGGTYDTLPLQGVAVMRMETQAGS